MRLSKFKMADTIWQLRVREKLKLCSKLVYGGFRNADHDFAIRLSKFKLADPIWRLKILKKFGFFSKLECRGFRGQ